MTALNRLSPVVIASLLLVLPVRAEKLPSIGQTAVVSPVGSDGGPAPGLELRWLPVISRDSLTDYAGRYLPGATLSGEGGLRLRGGIAQDTVYEVDGMRVRGLLLPLGMVERFDLATAGYGAEWSDALGGVMSVATASGGGRLRAGADVYRQSHQGRTTLTAAATVSAPIVKDRLFALLSIRGDAWREDGSLDPSGYLPRAPNVTSRTLQNGLKVTWNVATGQRLELLTLLDLARQDNISRLSLTPEAQPTYDDQRWTASLRWLGRLGAGVTAHAQVGFQQVQHDETPMLCRSEPAACDHVPATFNNFPGNRQAGNWTRHGTERTTDWQASGGIAVLLHEGPLLRERLRLSTRARIDSASESTRRPGDRLTEFSGSMPLAETFSFSNDPRIGGRMSIARVGWFSTDESRWLTTSAVESETRLFERLWIVPALGLAASGAQADTFTVVESALTPHLGLAWDPFGSGRTWLRAAYHERVGADLEDLARFAGPKQVSRRCAWDPDAKAFNRECVWSGGISSTVGLPCGPTNVGADGAPCAQAPRMARGREYSFAASHLLGEGVQASLDLVSRQVVGRPQILETNRVSSSRGDPGSGFRNGRNVQISDFSAIPDLTDQYLGATASLSRQTGAFRFLFAYTLARHQKTSTLGSRLDPYRIEVADTPGHSLRGLLRWNFAAGSIGAIYSYDSGLPYTRTFLNGTTSNFDKALARGAASRATFNDPADDRPTHYPDVQQMSLQARLHGQPLLHLDLDLYVDVLDLLASRTVTNDGASFVADSGAVSRIRVGLEFRH